MPDRPGAATLNRQGVRAAVPGAAAVTFLNPLVYVDTIVVLGGLATASDAPSIFVAGAVLASAVLFTGVACGARIVRPLLDTAGGATAVDAVSGLAMLGSAAALWASLF